MPVNQSEKDSLALLIAQGFADDNSARQGLRLLSAFAKIQNSKVREALLELVERISERDVQ